MLTIVRGCARCLISNLVAWTVMYLHNVNYSAQVCAATMDKSDVAIHQC